jgi:hypothetical protein
MLGSRDIEDLADVRLFMPVRAYTLARHASPTLTSQPFAPGPLRVIFAHPTDSEAGGALRIYHPEKDL